MRIVANGISIEIDDQGPPAGEPLLMIMGLGMQLIGWPDEMVQMLVARGFRVIRIDNRDAGLSESFDRLGVPNLMWAGLRHAMHLPVHSPYRLADMAADALGVLDTLGIARAHVCGASMGGMIAQHLAAAHPERVRSLSLLMTTSGARHLAQPSARMRHALMSRPAGPGVEAAVAHVEHLLQLIGSPAYPSDPARMHERVLAAVQRAWRPAGTARQMLAILADGDRSALLPRIAAPTLVIHGEADPLVPVACGRDLAQRIPGCVADIVGGMGHDLPLQLLGRFVQGVHENAQRSAG